MKQDVDILHAASLRLADEKIPISIATKMEVKREYNQENSFFALMAEKSEFFRFMLQFMLFRTSGERATLTVYFNKRFPGKIEIHERLKMGNNMGVWCAKIVFDNMRFIMCPKYFTYGDEGYIFDTNSLAIMYNMTNSRKKSILAQFGDITARSSDRFVDTLISFFKSADDLIALHGSTGYKAIKAMYAICDNWTAKLADKVVYVPKVITDPFDEHVDDMVTKLLMEDNLDCSSMVELIRSCGTTDEVNNIYSAVKHSGFPMRYSHKATAALFESAGIFNDDYLEGEHYDLPEKLASLAARRILMYYKAKDQKWYVDATLMDQAHPLHRYMSSTPALDVPRHVENHPLVRHHWHELPLIPVAHLTKQIPETVFLVDKSVCKPLSTMTKEFENRGHSCHFG